MKLVIHPPVEPERLAKIVEAARPMTVVNAAGRDRGARVAIADADAFFGKITPALLAAARRLRWVQAPTASLEHYVFPELVDHPCVLTNMRGLFSDVIADQVFGYVLCFARNLHRYIRNQLEARWAPVGGEAAAASGFVDRARGVVSAIDRAHLHLADHDLGVVGLGQIGAEIARRGLAFGMRVIGRRSRSRPRGAAGVAALWRLDRLPDLLGASDFVVIAAPHTPETVRLFRRAQFRQMKRTGYLINIGRGAIVDLADLVDGAPGGRDRRRGPGRVRDRAAAGGASAVGAWRT